MTSNRNARIFRRDMLVAGIMVVSGLGMSVGAIAQIATTGPQLAQATPPLQSTPGAESKPSAPEPATTGQRPQETPPQPARPDAEAQSSGAKSALPPAPAEKTAPPIPSK
ncbi:MAG: hypothetical protein ABWY18_09820 [Tardiphaga sp.]